MADQEEIVAILATALAWAVADVDQADNLGAFHWQQLVTLAVERLRRLTPAQRAALVSFLAALG